MKKRHRSVDETTTTNNNKRTKSNSSSKIHRKASSKLLPPSNNLMTASLQALHDDNKIFPISDEKYAEELQLEEALIHSASLLSSPTDNKSPIPLDSPTSHTSSSLASSMKNKEPLVESTENEQVLALNYCRICMDSKTESEMFRNINVCSHMFCTDCIRDYVAAKIKENLAMVKCPLPECKGIIGPEVCKSIVPKQVLERWEDVLCESLIMGSQKYYCPFKDCSAMLVDDGGVAVTSSECPFCNRLFCAQCRVAWHCGMDCSEYKSLKKGEKNPEDLMLMDLAKSKKWMRCPSCRFYVEKRSGCSYISCRCGHRFCYLCGKESNNYIHNCVHY